MNFSNLVEAKLCFHIIVFSYFLEAVFSCIKLKAYSSHLQLICIQYTVQTQGSSLEWKVVKLIIVVRLELNTKVPSL